jgi:hypothetical protein
MAKNNTKERLELAQGVDNAMYPRRLNSPWIMNIGDGRYKLLPNWAIGLLKGQYYGKSIAPDLNQTGGNIIPEAYSGNIAAAPMPIGWNPNLARQFFSLFSDIDPKGAAYGESMGAPYNEFEKRQQVNQSSPWGKSPMFGGMASPYVSLDNLDAIPANDNGVNLATGMPTMPTTPISAYTRRLLEKNNLIDVIKELSGTALQAAPATLGVQPEYQAFNPEYGRAGYPEAVKSRPSQWRIAQQK